MRKIVLLFLMLLSSAFSQTDKKNISSENEHPVGIGFNASSLGAGMDVAVGLTKRINLRGGFHALSFGKDYSRDGIQYDGTLKLRSGEAEIDFFPFHGRFHITGGALIYNGNHIDATAFVPAGQGFELGGGNYASSPTDPIHGNGKLEFMRAAPMFKIGWGNIAKRDGHLSFTFESGIAFHGDPRATLSLHGTACSLSLTLCRNAATDATIQQDIRDEETDLNRRASKYKVYPIVQVGFAYRF